MMNYNFNNKQIEKEFKELKQYYFLGKQSYNFFISKIIYEYLKTYDSMNFCCNFTLVEKIIKKLSSNDYVSKFSNEEFYSFLGALLEDNCTTIDYIIIQEMKIEEFLLSIYKKEDNKYMIFKNYIKKNNYSFSTSYSFNNTYYCDVYLNELNIHFNASSNYKIDAKYCAIVKMVDYLQENNLLYSIIDIIKEYNLDNAFEKLNFLHEKGYIKKPSFIYIEHTEFENPKYEVRCMVEDISFYSVKINSNKETARNLASLAMLEMIVRQTQNN